MKDYFYKPPINKLSLTFLEKSLESAYRISYQEEVCVCMSCCLCAYECFCLFPPYPEMLQACHSTVWSVYELTSVHSFATITKTVYSFQLCCVHLWVYCICAKYFEQIVLPVFCFFGRLVWEACLHYVLTRLVKTAAKRNHCRTLNVDLNEVVMPSAGVTSEVHFESPDCHGCNCCYIDWSL